MKLRVTLLASAAVMALPTLAVAQGSLSLDTFTGQVAGRLRALYPDLTGVVTATGAITPRASADRAADTRNMRDFGAVCDGQPHPLSGVFPSLAVAQVTYPFVTSLTQTRDTVALQAAINAVSNSAPGLVQMCQGLPYLDGTILLTRPNLTVRGYGKRGTTLALPSHTFDVFRTVPGNANVEVRDFSVINFGARTPGNWLFNDAGGVTGASAVNIQMTQMESGVRGVGALFKMRDVHGEQFDYGAGIGFQIAGVGEGYDILDSWFAGASIGASVLSGAAITLSNVELPGNGNALKVAPPTGSTVFSLTLDKVWSDTSGSIGTILDGTGGTITRVRVANSWFNSSGSHGIQVRGNVWGLSLTAGTEISLNAGDGLHIDAGAVLKGLQVDAAKIGGNGGAGMSVGAGVMGWSLTNSVVGPVADYGPNGTPLYVDTGGDDFVVTGNRMRGNSSAKAIVAPGAHTVVSNNIE